MAKQLVIVESPAKAKTINRYLGNDYQVLASYGHVRDLLPKEGAVDPDHHFRMKYQIIDRNSKHVDAIAKALRQADTLYLATDPDREGEAIAWHLYELLRERKLLSGKQVGRVVFHEITKRAIQEALTAPRELSLPLVNAQQARRALDYLVGFNLSPLLWKKIRRGLSAGRVQSPALRMIVEREQEITAFVSREYWSVEADLQAAEGAPFIGRLTQFAGDKVEQFTITDGERAATVEQTLQRAAAGELQVMQVEKKQRRRNPAAPFTTSTLQQEAARKLGFTAQRTMRVAQQLYEGIDLGGETVGLISYMRTDSVTLAQEAIADIRALISERYGSDQIPKSPRLFKTKAKNAQEAHEAIRPTSVARLPESLRGALNKEQAALYELIWKRTVACQMIHATINTVAVDLGCGGEGEAKGEPLPHPHRFRATGSTIATPGFIQLYQEGRDDVAEGDSDEDRLLPPLQPGMWLTLLKLRPEQHFTEPPPRYSEATLVKSLEEYGIGRPSTYAAIISTLQQREYVEMDRKRFLPTDVGEIVNRFLTEHFTRYVDYRFTANLEDELDAVSRGEEEWVPLLERFWQPFHQLIAEKEQSVQRKDVTQEALDEACPKCGKPLSIRLGRRGRFIGCTGYPECDYTRDLNGDSQPPEPEKVADRSCPKCGGELLIRQGRYGRFIGCGNYPKCNHLESLEQPQETGVDCPKCGQGTLLQRKSRRGKIFFSCSTYPKCDYAVWNPPLAERCPQCDWPILTLKQSRRRGVEKVCPQADCGYSEVVATEDSAERGEATIN